jgi:hypothetical protein
MGTLVLFRAADKEDSAQIPHNNSLDLALR